MALWNKFPKKYQLRINKSQTAGKQLNSSSCGSILENKDHVHSVYNDIRESFNKVVTGMSLQRLDYIIRRAEVLVRSRIDGRKFFIKT